MGGYLSGLFVDCFLIVSGNYSFLPMGAKILSVGLGLVVLECFIWTLFLSSSLPGLDVYLVLLSFSLPLLFLSVDFILRIGIYSLLLLLLLLLFSSLGPFKCYRVTSLSFLNSVVSCLSVLMSQPIMAISSSSEFLLLRGDPYLESISFLDIFVDCLLIFLLVKSLICIVLSIVKSLFCRSLFVNSMIAS